MPPVEALFFPFLQMQFPEGSNSEICGEWFKERSACGLFREDGPRNYAMKWEGGLIPVAHGTARWVPGKMPDDHFS